MSQQQTQRCPKCGGKPETMYFGDCVYGKLIAYEDTRCNDCGEQM